MSTEKATQTATTAQAAIRPFTVTECWKPQAAALQSLYGEVMTFTEARLRKQADLLHELASAKDLPAALKVQTAFVQECCANSTRDAVRAFSALCRAAGAKA